MGAGNQIRSSARTRAPKRWAIFLLHYFYSFLVYALLSLCVAVHRYVCLCAGSPVWAHADVCTCMYGDLRLILCIFLDYSVPYTLKESFLWKCQLWLMSLASLLALGIPHFCLPELCQASSSPAKPPPQSVSLKLSLPSNWRVSTEGGHVSSHCKKRRLPQLLTILLTWNNKSGVFPLHILSDFWPELLSESPALFLHPEFQLFQLPPTKQFLRPKNQVGRWSHGGCFTAIFCLVSFADLINPSHKQLKEVGYASQLITRHPPEKTT